MRRVVDECAGSEAWVAIRYTTGAEDGTGGDGSLDTEREVRMKHRRGNAAAIVAGMCISHEARFMASIRYGVVVADARGKVGGGVFTRGRSGSTLRSRVKPHDPNSATQSAARNAMTIASRAYKALSGTNLGLWLAYANSITRTQGTSGASYHPTPINIFTELASKFLQYAPAGTPPVTPPTTPFTGDTITVTAAGAAGKITFTGSGANAAGVATELLYQKLASTARTPGPRAYKHGAFKVMAAMALTQDVTGLAAGYYIPANRFVKIATGEQVGLTILPGVTVT